MKNKGRRNRLIAFVVAMILIVAAAIPALAAPGDNFEYPPTEGGKMTFTKYLVMDKDANVPSDAAFSFKVTAGEAQDESSGTLAVYAGKDPGKVEIYAYNGNPTSGTSGSYVVSLTSGTTTDTVPNISIEDNQKYVKKDIVVDFSHVTFDKPGVYRYILTELETEGYTTEVTATRTIDLYVENALGSGNTQILENEKIVMYEETITTAPYLTSGTASEAQPSGAEKTDNYINTYATTKLVIKKMVDGNQANKAEYFDFELKISKAHPNTVYNLNLDGVYLSNADLSGTNYTPKTNDNPATIKTDDNGEATLSFKLQNGHYLEVLGLSEGTWYTVQETDNAKLNKEGYTTTVGAINNTPSGTTATSGTAPVYTSGERMVTLSGTGILTVNNVVFTNTKQGTIPTGINMKVVPIIAIAVVFIIGISVLTIHMAKKEEEE